MKWISVEEKLPDEKMNCVIIFIDSDKMSEWAQQDEDNQRFYDDNFSTSVDIWNPVAVNHWAKQAVPRWITHWMPLPDPPVEYTSSPPLGVVHERVDAVATFDSVAQGPSSPQVTPPKYDPSWHGSQAHTFVTDKPVGSEVKPRTGE